VAQPALSTQLVSLFLLTPGASPRDGQHLGLWGGQILECPLLASECKLFTRTACFQPGILRVLVFL
jgi:hypothetical protein